MESCMDYNQPVQKQHTRIKMNFLDNMYIC
jgi:hypothetical protein